LVRESFLCRRDRGGGPCLDRNLATEPAEAYRSITARSTPAARSGAGASLGGRRRRAPPPHPFDLARSEGEDRAVPANLRGLLGQPQRRDRGLERDIASGFDEVEPVRSPGSGEMVSPPMEIVSPADGAGCGPDRAPQANQPSRTEDAFLRILAPNMRIRDVPTKRQV
jgi:hypothetical protein